MILTHIVYKFKTLNLSSRSLFFENQRNTRVERISLNVCKIYKNHNYRKSQAWYHSQCLLNWNTLVWESEDPSSPLCFSVFTNKPMTKLKAAQKTVKSVATKEFLNLNPNSTKSLNLIRAIVIKLLINTNLKSRQRKRRHTTYQGTNIKSITDFVLKNNASQKTVQ